MTYLIFIAFYNIIFLIGRGAICFFTYAKLIENKNKIFNLEITYLYPLIGLFVIGNLTLLLHFFTAITTFTSICMFTILISFNLLKMNINFNNKLLITNLCVPMVLSFSTNSASLHFDAGLYHLQFQNWLRSYKIIENLVLANKRHGYSSIFDYISSNFWWNDNFLFLHFINLVFISSFLSILIYFLFFQENLFLKLSSLTLFIYAFLDNFGYQGGRNGFIYIESIGKQDTAFAIVYFLIIVFTTYSIKYNNYDLDNLFIIGTLSLFSIQLRLFGIFTVFMFVLYIYKLAQIFSVFEILKSTYLQIFIGVLWLIKNTVTTGCIFFPITITCFEQRIPNIKSLSRKENSSLAEYYKAYKQGDNLIMWSKDFLNDSINLQIFINFLFSFIFIRILFKLFFKISRKKNTLLLLTVFSTIFFNSLTLFLTGPGNRFLIGIFLVLIGITYFITLNKIEFRIKFFIPFSNFFKIFISTMSIILIPLYTNYLDLGKGLKLIIIEIEKVNYTKIDNFWGTNSTNTSLCWDRIDCLYGNPKIFFNEEKLRIERK